MKEKSIDELFILLQDKFGSRMIGYIIDDKELIYGQIDGRRFTLRCHLWNILFQVAYENDDEVLFEVSKIIRRYIGNDEIDSEYVITSKDRNVNELQYHLHNAMDIEKGFSYIKTK